MKAKIISTLNIEKSDELPGEIFDNNLLDKLMKAKNEKQILDLIKNKLDNLKVD